MSFLLAILGIVILYALQSFLYRKYWNHSLAVSIKFQSDHATQGDDLLLTETIRNQKLLPLPILRMKFVTSRFLEFYDTENSQISDNYYRDDILSVLMYQQLVRTLRFRCSHRGFFTIDHADIVCTDLFLSNSLVNHIHLNEHLYVYPRLLDDSLISIPFKKMLGMVLTKRFFNEDPFELAGIREYQTYDTMKNVNWKASAKTGSLKVNVHDYTSSQQIHLLLNLESQTLLKYEDLLELSIQLAATYANACIHSGIPVSLVCNGLDICTHKTINIPAGSSTNHMTKINEALARITTDLAPKPFMKLFHETASHLTDQDYIVLISTYQKTDLQDALCRLKKEHQDFLWILPVNRYIECQIAPTLNDFVSVFHIKE